MVSPKNRSAIAKKAECLYANLEGLINRVGIERIGFVTFTFREHVTCRKEAGRIFNSLATNHLRPLSIESIIVPERQGNDRFHFHLAAAFPYDIRTGFDFAACSDANAFKRLHYQFPNFGWDSPASEREFNRLQSVYFKSANQRLRDWWRYVRELPPAYKLGRCETLPVISNGAAVSRYMGAYVTTASDARTLADKGLRTVRYSLTERASSIRFGWRSGAGETYRRGCQIIAIIHGLDADGLQRMYGNKWGWRWRRVLATFGERYDEAIVYCAKIPEWADMPSRMGFLRSLCHALQNDYRLDANFLQTEIDCPF